MNKTHFGFESIDWKEKTKRVQSLFAQVAGEYDLMNDLMSGGFHRCWKQHLVDQLPLKPNDVILDVAGGTGDIALRILEAYPHLNLQVMVCDLTEQMILKGRERALNKGLFPEWICGDGQNLPLSDDSVSVYTIAFGLRNITHVEKALREAYRVLKPGGHFACLEFSQVDHMWLQSMYDIYSFSVIPWIGEKVAHNRGAYQYLVESIRRFPSAQDLKDLMSSVGFKDVGWQKHFGGVSCLHQAKK